MKISSLEKRGLTLKFLKSYKILNSNLENILNCRFEYIKLTFISFYVVSSIFRFQASAGRQRPRGPGPRMSLFPSISSSSSCFPWWDTGHIQVDNEEFRGPGRRGLPVEVCSLRMSRTISAAREVFRRHWDSNSAKLLAAKSSLATYILLCNFCGNLNESTKILL